MTRLPKFSAEVATSRGGDSYRCGSVQGLSGDANVIPAGVKKVLVDENGRIWCCNCQEDLVWCACEPCSSR